MDAVVVVRILQYDIHGCILVYFGFSLGLFENALYKVLSYFMGRRKVRRTEVVVVLGAEVGLIFFFTVEETV